MFQRLAFDKTVRTIQVAALFHEKNMFFNHSGSTCAGHIVQFAWEQGTDHKSNPPV
jgi:hypothetical protein